MSCRLAVNSRPSCVVSHVRIFVIFKQPNAEQIMVWIYVSRTFMVSSSSHD